MSFGSAGGVAGPVRQSARSSQWFRGAALHLVEPIDGVGDVGELRRRIGRRALDPIEPVGNLGELAFGVADRAVEIGLIAESSASCDFSARKTLFASAVFALGAASARAARRRRRTTIRRTNRRAAASAIEAASSAKRDERGCAAGAAVAPARPLPLRHTPLRRPAAACGVGIKQFVARCRSPASSLATRRRGNLCSVDARRLRSLARLAGGGFEPRVVSVFVGLRPGSRPCSDPPDGG